MFFKRNLKYVYIHQNANVAVIWKNFSAKKIRQFGHRECFITLSLQFYLVFKNIKLVYLLVVISQRELVQKSRSTVPMSLLMLDGGFKHVCLSRPTWGNDPS